MKQLFFLFILISSNALAANIPIVATEAYLIPQSIHTLQSAKPKIIKLLKIELSDKMQKVLSNQLNNANPSLLNFSINSISLPYSVQLDMNSVPVLDQGRHGTCTTFAVTAAINAALNQGDYISQLCLLQLGNAIEKSGYIPSGWEGSWADTILNEIGMFGIINKQQQFANGCGGITVYPTDEDTHPSTEISPIDYHQSSESLQGLVGWSLIVDKFRTEDKITTKQIIENIKKALVSQNRITYEVRPRSW